MLKRRITFLEHLRTLRPAPAFVAGLLAVCGLNAAASSTQAAWHSRWTLLLAQEAAAEGLPIIEWAIVVVLIGAALFVVCRGSRRN
jgi:hypothetical protein